MRGMSWDELISHLIWMYMVTQVYAPLGSTDTVQKQQGHWRITKDIAS